MKNLHFSTICIAVAVLFILGSCNKKTDKSISQSNDLHPKTVTEEMMSENGTNADEQAITFQNNTSADISAKGESKDRGDGHYLYTESNETGWNKILIYKIRSNGSLHYEGATTSGGAGTGKGLGSQGALVLDKQHEWLYAVNAGSNSVSSFKIHNDGSLSLAHTENSRGKEPNSVSLHGDVLYVLNHGSDNIHGFSIGSGGTLSHIDGSTKPLSGKGTDAPQISFTPNGDWIIVTEKATNNILSFKVKNNGGAAPAIITSSTGATPFGFDFARNNLMIVSNAAGGAAGAGSATSYYITGSGFPYALNGAVPNHEAAPCWVATTKYGTFAYVTNTAGNTISSYYVAPWGYLYLVRQTAATTDVQPLDIVVAANNYYVYELNGTAQTIGGYRRTFFGGLDAVETASGLPVAATGLATY